MGLNINNMKTAFSKDVFSPYIEQIRELLLNNLMCKSEMQHFQSLTITSEQINEQFMIPINHQLY